MAPKWEGCGVKGMTIWRDGTGSDVERWDRWKGAVVVSWLQLTVRHGHRPQAAGHTRNKCLEILPPKLSVASRAGFDH